MSNTSILSDRAVIAVRGEDARTFLQGLITNDINKVTRQTAIFAALLSPQGKFLHDFFIMELEGNLLLETAKATATDVIKRLSMYKLRAKVEIAEMPHMRVGAEWGQIGISNLESGNFVLYKDPRLAELGNRFILYNSEFQILNSQNESAYELHRLKLGVPEGNADLTYNRSFPMQWGYDKLNAIDFNKGCYVGQEVTARSKHLGELRKLVHQVTADKELPPKDTPVMSGEKEVGTMAGSMGAVGLALLNIEAAHSGKPLYTGGIEIKASLPQWIR